MHMASLLLAAVVAVTAAAAAKRANSLVSGTPTARQPPRRLVPLPWRALPTVMAR